MRKSTDNGDSRVPAALRDSGDSAGTVQGRRRDTGDSTGMARPSWALPGPGWASWAPLTPTTATLSDHHTFHREKSTAGKKRIATSHQKNGSGKGREAHEIVTAIILD